MTESRKVLLNSRRYLPRSSDTELVLKEQNVRLPLVVHARAGHCVGNRASTIENSKQNLKCRIDDARATCSAGRQDRLACSIQNQRRAHARQGSFARSDRVGL